MAVPSLLMLGGLLWLGYRNAQLEARLDALGAPAASAVPTSVAAPTATGAADAGSAPDVPPLALPMRFGELDRAAVLDTWKLVLPRVRLHCHEHDSAAPPAAIEVTLQLDQRGGVMMARASGGHPSALAKCVAALAAQHQFPAAGEPTEGVIKLPWGSAPAAAASGPSR